MYRPEYATGAGTYLRDRGPYNPIPVNNYLSGTNKSNVYRGPGYYVPSEERWLMYHEHRSLPPETKRDAILFESEDSWVNFQRSRDAHSNPSGISMSGVPTLYTGVPIPNLLPAQTNAMNRKWSGPGYFLSDSNKWFHDHDSPAIPPGSLLFYNEEDWLKFKNMVNAPNVASIRK